MLLDDPLDPRVREYAHLRAATLRLRAEGPDGARDGVFIAEGELVIERALALGYRMRSLLLLEQRLERFGRLAPRACRCTRRRRPDALDHGLRGAPRGARVVRPQPLPSVDRARARRAAGCPARGRQQSHQRRRVDAEGLGAGHDRAHVGVVAASSSRTTRRASRMSAAALGTFSGRTRRAPRGALQSP